MFLLMAVAFAGAYVIQPRHPNIDNQVYVAPLWCSIMAFAIVRGMAAAIVSVVKITDQEIETLAAANVDRGAHAPVV